MSSNDIPPAYLIHRIVLITVLSAALGVFLLALLLAGPTLGRLAVATFDALHDVWDNMNWELL